MKTCLLLIVALSLALVPAASAQVPPEKAEATFKVADGLEFKLWASEPLFVNPTCMDIDHKGRVWVCESVNYRCTLHRQPLRRKEGDRILILEDSKGTGKADKVTVFYQSPKILAPLGIAVAPYPDGKGVRVYVCQSPDILVFEDKEGKGKADGPPRKLLTGFGGVDHDHGVHGIMIGPDGKLYFSVGDTGVKDLKSSDGKGRKWTSNDTDCRAGTIWRCDLDGKNLELIAHNFRNEYEPCVDSFGTIFTSDNDDDGSEQTRICYVMPGGNYGYHPRGPGQSHWHEEQPGVVPKILRTGFGSPTGMCVYEGSLLPLTSPKRKRGGFVTQLLHTDAGPREVRCYHLKPDGAGYQVEKEVLVSSTDTWFRPSDICVAPDGSAFVADWYDPGVGGHGIGDWTRGRIYRLAPKGNKYSVPKTKLDSPKAVVQALNSPCLAVRHMGFSAIGQMDADAVLRVADTGFPDSSPSFKARLFWAMTPPLTRGAADPEKKPRAMGYAMMQLADKQKQMMPFLFRLDRDMTEHSFAKIIRQVMNDPKEDKDFDLIGMCETVAGQRELLLILRDYDPKLAKEIIYPLVKQYDGKDRFYLEAIGIAVGHHDKKRRETILADFEKHFPEWNDKVADLVWELQPPSVMPKLGKRLADAKLTPGQRTRIVDILTVSDYPDAGKVILEALQTDQPGEVRVTAIDSLRRYLPNKWRSLRDSPELTKAVKKMLDNGDTRLTGLQVIAAAEHRASLSAVAEIAADTKQPIFLQMAAIHTLAALPSDKSVDTLGKILKDGPKEARSDTLQAIGRISQGKDGQPGVKRAQSVLAMLVVLPETPLDIRRGAVEALAGSREGSAWLLAAHGKKRLPKTVQADAGRLLRNSPYPDLRKKALIAFPPAGKLDPKKLPKIDVLAKLKGNPAKGKQLLAASVKNDMQCLKCHTIRGLGGQVGPDLSVIGKKASRENLFESILYPSKAIADQYLTWTIITKDGKSVSGLIIEETPDHVLIRDANAKDTKIDKKQIEAREKDPKSLMPDDLLRFISEDELVDIVEYLFNLKTSALAMDFWHIAGPFDNGDNDAGLDKVFPPEKAVDLKAEYKGKIGKVRWRTVKPDGTGYVDLQAHYGKDSQQIVSYLHREIESPAEQEATVLIGTDDGAKLFVNGDLVFTERRHDAAIPEKHAVKVKLKKGRNQLLLKINNGDGAHGFYFTILAEQELRRVDR
jgi:putative membrane-bound dehydrogenase-like protein